jgi:hypothetical protein
MKKIIITAIIILVVIVFFYPKDKYFSCGGIVCFQEAYDKSKKEEENTICLGIKKAPSAVFTETDAKGCYGIFINKSYF